VEYPVWVVGDLGLLSRTKSSSEAMNMLLSVDSSKDEKESSETVHTISSSELSKDVCKDWEDMVDERERDDTTSSKEEAAEVAVKVGEERTVELEVDVVSI
jgi:hypothetical protein